MENNDHKNGEQEPLSEMIHIPSYKGYVPPNPPPEVLQQLQPEQPVNTSQTTSSQPEQTVSQTSTSQTTSSDPE